MHRALVKVLEKVHQNVLAQGEGLGLGSEAGLAASSSMDLLETLSRTLSNGELTTLLLEVYKRRAESVLPHELYQGLAENRFIQPATTDPIRLRRCEADMLELAQRAGFTPVELSPLAPLGASACYGRVSQNNVLSALRGCEVLSDPTNSMLPLMVQRLCDKQNPSDALHWAATIRAVRTNLMDFPDFKPHFALFAAASLLRSKDPAALIPVALNHLRLQQRIFAALGLNGMHLSLRIKGVKKHLGDRLLAALTDSGEFSHVLESASGSPYYEGIQIKTFSGDAELGDCGFVDWGARLKGDGRLHAFISGIGIERMLVLADAGHLQGAP